MKLQVFLNQPFFYLDSQKNKGIYIVSSTIFVLFFLILFQPYGITEELNNPVNSIISIALFFLTISFCTFLGLCFSQFFLIPIFNFHKVSNKEYIFWLFIEALLITLIYFIFSFFIPDLGNDFENELNIFFQLKNYFRCLTVLLFPFFGTIIYVLIKELNHEIQVLENEIYMFQDVYKTSNASKEHPVLIYDENKNIELELQIDDFLYAESSNQYVLIYYSNANSIKKHLVRARLKTIVKTLKHFPVEQCHRSYAINLLHVKSLIRKDGKTYLIMNTIKNKEIPVSKSYLNSIKKRILNS